MQWIKLTQITRTARIFPLLLFSRAKSTQNTPLLGHYYKISLPRQSPPWARHERVHANWKQTVTWNENCGESAGSFSRVWFHQSYAPGWSPENSGDTEAGSVGDWSGSEAAGKRVLDPATRGSSAAAVIAEIFSIPALPESWLRLLQKIWLSLSRAVF